jgi:PAS domain-containing protein
MTLPELQQAIVVAVTDVNAEKRAEEKSLHDAHELRCIIDAIPQAMVVYNPDGHQKSISACVLTVDGAGKLRRCRSRR